MQWKDGHAAEYKIVVKNVGAKVKQTGLRNYYLMHTGRPRPNTQTQLIYRGSVAHAGGL
jgi:hypothetical protein